MLRRLSTFLSAVSLVLCAATCALWARSYRVPERYCPPFGEKRVYVAASTGGNIWVQQQTIVQTAGFTGFRGYQRVPDEEVVDLHPLMQWSVLGFGYLSDSFPSRRITRVTIGLPYWFQCAAFAAYPLIRRLRRKRLLKAAGFCPNCGYDLRATPDRCPECGAVPAADRQS